MSATASRLALAVLLLPVLAACAARGPGPRALEEAREVALLPGAGTDPALAACVAADLARRAAVRSNRAFVSRTSTTGTARELDGLLVAGRAVAGMMNAQEAASRKEGNQHSASQEAGRLESLADRARASTEVSPRDEPLRSDDDRAVLELALRLDASLAQRYAELAELHAALFRAAAAGDRDARAEGRLLRAVARAPALEEIYRERWERAYRQPPTSCPSAGA